MGNANNTEVFKDIPHYEGMYQASNLGRIWSIKTQRIMKPNTCSNHGYQTIVLTKNGKQKRELIHRLIALTFLGNPPKGKTDVNHIDENKNNNKLENLEWVSRRENLNHGSHNLRVAKSKSIPVCQYALNGELLNVFESITMAHKNSGVDKSQISACCKNKAHYNTAGGYLWKYLV